MREKKQSSERIREVWRISIEDYGKRIKKEEYDMGNDMSNMDNDKIWARDMRI